MKSAKEPAVEKENFGVDVERDDVEKRKLALAGHAALDADAVDAEVPVVLGDAEEMHLERVADDFKLLGRRWWRWIHGRLRADGSALWAGAQRGGPRLVEAQLSISISLHRRRLHHFARFEMGKRCFHQGEVLRGPKTMVRPV